MRKEPTALAMHIAWFTFHRTDHIYGDMMDRGWINWRKQILNRFSNKCVTHLKRNKLTRYSKQNENRRQTTR